MSEPGMGDSTLFFLVPKNNRARDVVELSENAYLISKLPDGKSAIRAGFPIRNKSSTTLLTIGRASEANVHVPGASIARIQCSFEVNLDSGVVMLYDRSHLCTTQVSGKHCAPFEPDRARKVVVMPGFNDVVQFGGPQCDLVVFELHWCDNIQTSRKKIIQYGLIFGVRRQPAHMAMTELPDEVFSQHKVNAQPSQDLFAMVEEPDSTESLIDDETDFGLPGPAAAKIQYKLGEFLGAGSFGQVFKAINQESKQFMAVKLLQQPADSAAQADWQRAVRYALQREVATLSKLSHQHIIDYIGSQGWGGPVVEIFMGLKEGTIESLIEAEIQPNTFVNTALRHTLRALDHLGFNGIIHRDVKPANILYTTRPDGTYLFQLGDFGVSNRAMDATTILGTSLFMAPEIASVKKQTSKLDVWSLFVTMVWTLDINEFRQTHFKNFKDIQTAVLSAASRADALSTIREMAIVNPDERASAAQMLVKLFNGDGLSTPRDQIPTMKASLLSTKGSTGQGVQPSRSIPNSRDVVSKAIVGNGVFEVSLSNTRSVDMLDYDQVTAANTAIENQQHVQVRPSKNGSSPINLNPDAMSYILTSGP